MHNTGFLLKSGFPDVIYLLFGEFGLGTLIYVFFTRISSLMALLMFRMGNFGSILPLCFEFVFAGAILFLPGSVLGEMCKCVNVQVFISSSTLGLFVILFSFYLP